VIYRRTAHARAWTIFLVLACIAACGPNARQTQLRGAFAGLSAASGGLVSWDASHQAEIVAHATSAADGIAKLTAYKEARAKVVSAFAAGFHALASAAILGDAGPANLAAALAASAEAIAAWEALKGAP
jgi:hypothetical protein